MGRLCAKEKRERISATNGRLFRRAKVLSRERQGWSPPTPAPRGQGRVKGINKAAAAAAARALVYS